MIVVAGGHADPNIARIVQRLNKREEPFVELRDGVDNHPRLMWRLGEAHLWINGIEVRPAAVFLRYDVFTHAKDRRPESRKNATRWYYTILSWALAHEKVRFLNRRYGSSHATKPYNLQLAGQLGLETPDTVITNDADVYSCLHEDKWIAKPVDGGEYTQLLSRLQQSESWSRQAAEAPTLLQQRLVGPDLRIYGVGNRWFAFTLTSSEIDYRQSADVAIRSVRPPSDLTEPLADLMNTLGLDFGAADFKVCSRTGRYLFLEINSAPMFSGFDDVVSGSLSDAIVDWMLRPSTSE